MISDINFLDSIHVAAPCHVSWEGMEGDERTRLCQQCHKNVYNLSEMTRKQAIALVREQEGHELCVRFYRRADGTVLTDNCPVGLRAVRNTLVRRWAAVATLATVLLQIPRLSLAGNSPQATQKAKSTSPQNNNGKGKPPIVDKSAKGTEKSQSTSARQATSTPKKEAQPKTTAEAEKGGRAFMGSIGNVF